VIEAESLTGAGGWERGSDPAASGGAYLAWGGPPTRPGSPDPASIATITLEVPVPGTYRFSWSTQAPTPAPANQGQGDDDEPAARISIADVARFGPSSGGRYNGFVDITGGATGGFGWAATASVDGVHSDPAIEFDHTGTYLLQIAPGAIGHRIDRIIVHHESIDPAEAVTDRCS
jgi:hypothetical protein